MKATPAKLVLRMPISLHAQITDAAAKDGMSMNTWILTVLAQRTGEKIAWQPPLPINPKRVVKR